MKPQLLKLLTVGLITLAVFSPALLVWWRIWHYHSELMDFQPVVLSSDRAALHMATIAMPSDGRLSLSDADKSSIKAVALALVPLAFLSFIIAVSSGFWVGLWLSDRHQTRRTITLKQQIATLERLWQQSIY